MGIAQGKNRASRERKPSCGFCNVDLVEGVESKSPGPWWRGGFQAVCHGLYWERLC